MQVSRFFRRSEGGYMHWCPACSEMHAIGDGWTFNGDLDDRPTFAPSVRVSGKKIVRDAAGKWTGEWERDASGKPLPFVCHYFLQDGELRYCGDCTHGLANQTVPLPELPPELCDRADI